MRYAVEISRYPVGNGEWMWFARSALTNFMGERIYTIGRDLPDLYEMIEDLEQIWIDMYEGDGLNLGMKLPRDYFHQTGTVGNQQVFRFAFDGDGHELAGDEANR